MLTCTSAMADVCPVRSGFIPIERSPPMAKTAMLDNDQSITLMNTIDVYHTMINISCSCDRYVIHDISIYFSICLKYIYIYTYIYNILLYISYMYIYMCIYTHMLSAPPGPTFFEHKTTFICKAYLPVWINKSV